MKRTLTTVLLTLAATGVVVAAALALAASHAGTWLAQPAQPPRQADAIVVLGGDDGDRALRALALYREKMAPVVVLTGVERGTAAPPAALTWRAEFLEANGIPRSAMRLEVVSRNSWEEAQSVLVLMRQQGWRRAIVVSDPPHMRRLAWVWGRVFGNSGLQYVLVASEPDWWFPDEWWRDEKAGQFVITEYIKLAYYLARRS